MMEVSCLSQHSFSPREGHLNSIYNIFRYLQKNISNNTGRIAFDTSCVHTDEKMSEVRKRYLEEWKDIYPDVAEAHTRKKLEPPGEPVTIQVYVDANHAGNLENSISQSGILICVNNALMNFYSKI